MPTYPPTRTEPIVDLLHGVAVADPYRWLEDEHIPEVQAWMAVQDEVARIELSALPDRTALLERFRSLLYFDAVSAPLHRKGRFFYSRRHADREKSIVYWKQGEEGAEQVLFDPNSWSEDGTTGLGGWSPSRDGRYVAYAIKEHNSDETVTRIRDVALGTDLPDVIPGTKYASPSWTPDSSGFYYTQVPPIGEGVTIAERPGFAQVKFHRLGTEPGTDVVVHEATGNPKTFIHGAVSRDGRWLVVTVQHGWNASDVFVRDLTMPEGAWQTLVAGVDALFEVGVWNGSFYIHTNDGAPRYRVFRTEATRLAREAWSEIIPEGDATLEGISLVGNRIAASYLRNAATVIQVHELDGTFVRTVAMPPFGSSGGVSGNSDEDTGYFSYTSFTEPQVIYRTSIGTGEVAEWARITLPVDTSEMCAEQVFYPSKDGTRVSMFLLYRKGTERNGANRTILYGYGGFNVSLTPAFSQSRTVWLERGGVYAIPNLRGGGEYGEAWHRDGMLLKKQHVFDDFIAAAEYLIAERWTSPRHLAISGGSNGGLLVGAALTQRPDLFRAVCCAVPLLDMLRYHLSGSGQTWIPEYGSADDPAQFAALHAYSPYRVAIDAGPRAYPAVYFESADHDDRVDPLHARKLAAALQAVQTTDLPVLLRIERNAGHGGADMVRQTVERLADQLGFLEQQLS